MGMGQTLQRDSSAVARRPRRWIRRTAIAIGALAIAGLIFGTVVLPRLRRRDCATTSRLDTDGIAVVVCQREYAQTRLPQTGAVLADALRRSDNIDAAAAVANELLSTDARANALQILAKIAVKQDRIDDAISLLQEARKLHRTQGDHLGLARDDQSLSKQQELQKHYAEALLTVDEGIAEAGTAGDSLVLSFCHLTAARVLTAIGHFEAADQEMERAAPLLSLDRDLAQFWYARGNLEQEIVRSPLRLGHGERAIAAFEHSVELATRSQMTSLLLNLHLNLVYSLAEVGRLDDADRHLAEAAVLDRGRKYEAQRAQLAARIAYHRGNLSLAYSLNELQYPAIKNDDERIEVCVLQARTALTNNDLAAAAMWAKRGVDAAERIRASQPEGELRPWVLATRREPFEALFTAYARAGRTQDAVMVFDQWQSRTLLDEMARPSPDLAARLSSMATKVQSLGQWLPAVSNAPLMTIDAKAVDQILAALARIDLIGLVVADGDVWRLTAIHGRLRLDDLGPLAKLSDRLERFTSAPTDRARADELGALLLPDDIVRKTDDELYVVLDAQFAGLPFVALRRDDQPLIAMRPVMRAPRIPVVSRCEPRAGTAKALVLADAAGDLPDARRESSLVASLFGTTPLVGDAATSSALFAAKSEPLLHVAVHADIDAGGGALRLHDRSVSAPEISASKLAPSLVVLSACATARSSDPELAGSLSTAFLAAGSLRVVATLRLVSDPGSLELTHRFYDARGVDDPVRVLARIQAELARTSNTDWPNFAVFGASACLPPS